MLSPAVYLQKFSPKLYVKEDDKRFDTSSTLDNDVNLGLGGDLALRYLCRKVYRFAIEIRCGVDIEQ